MGRSKRKSFIPGKLRLTAHSDSELFQVKPWKNPNPKPNVGPWIDPKGSHSYQVNEANHFT